MKGSFTEDRQKMFSRVRLVSLMTIGSRILGLIRDIGMAMCFGNGLILDAFTVAFRIPNTARAIFGEGALSTAFIPKYISLEHDEGRASANQFALDVFWSLLKILGVLTLCGEILLAAVLLNFTPDYSASMLIKLTMLMLPYLPLICLAALLNAVLHAQHVFSWPAVSPIVFNLVWLSSIVVVIIITGIPYQQAYLIAGSLLLGGVFQLYIPWHKLRQQEFSPLSPGYTSIALSSLFKSMLPVMLGLSITQINTMLDSIFAWYFANLESFPVSMRIMQIHMDQGTAAALYLGQRMYQFPLGVFGVALGTVLFPAMTKHAEKKDYESLKRDLLMGLKLVAIIGIPASAGLMVMAHPVVSLLFQHGQFDSNDTIQTAEMVFAYGTAVWAYIALLIIHRGFYALNDRFTPLYIGLASVIINIIFSIIFISNIGAMGLALGTAITAMIQTFFSLRLLIHKIGSLNLKELVWTVTKVICMTGIMALVIWFSMHLITEYVPMNIGHRITRILMVTVPFSLGFIAYSFLCRILNVHEFFELLLLRKKSLD